MKVTPSGVFLGLLMASGLMLAKPAQASFDFRNSNLSECAANPSLEGDFSAEDNTLLISQLDEALAILAAKTSDQVRVELMRDWIERARDSRPYSRFDPRWIKVAYELSRFEKLLEVPKGQLRYSFQEMADTLRRAREFLQSE